MKLLPPCLLCFRMNRFQHSQHCSVLVNITLTILKKVQSLSVHRLYNLAVKLIPSDAVTFKDTQDMVAFLHAHPHYYKYNSENDDVCQKGPEEQWPNETMEKEAVSVLKEKVGKREFALLSNLHGVFDKDRQREIFQFLRQNSLSQTTTGKIIVSKLLSLIVKYPEYLTLCGEKVSLNLKELCTFEILIEQVGIISSLNFNNGNVKVYQKNMMKDIFFDKKLLGSHFQFLSTILIIGKHVKVDAVLSPYGTRHQWQATYIQLIGDNPATSQKLQTEEIDEEENEERVKTQTQDNLTNNISKEHELSPARDNDNIRENNAAKCENTDKEPKSGRTTNITNVQMSNSKEANNGANASVTTVKSQTFDSPIDEIKHLKLQLEQTKLKCINLEQELRKYVNCRTCDTKAVSTQTMSTGDIMSTNMCTST